MIKPVAISTLLALSFGMHAQQLYVSGDAILYVAPEANLEVGGDLENEGTLLNTGKVSLYGNWTVNNVFNGNEGSLDLVGGQDQLLNPGPLTLHSLTLNLSGVASISSNEISVLDKVSLTNGVGKISDSTRFVLENNVRVIGGSVASYFEGRLTYQGSGIRKFPVGWSGIYAPITMLEVFGSDPELTVFYRAPNEQTPIPGDQLLGVSSEGIWEVALTNGSVNPTPIQIDFKNEDLENFEIRNDIRHRINSPVIAVSDSPGGVFRTLGVETLLDTDSSTYGSITTEDDYQLGDTIQTAYFAIALAPRVDPNGLVYIPEIFSPAASDPDNRTFRVFGEKISEENFKMDVFNRFGSLVYSTQSFSEANEVGWDGINQRTGNEEPSGLYYYQVVLTKENGEILELQGPFYLQR